MAKFAQNYNTLVAYHGVNHRRYLNDQGRWEEIRQEGVYYTDIA